MEETMQQAPEQQVESTNVEATQSQEQAAPSPSKQVEQTEQQPQEQTPVREKVKVKHNREEIEVDPYSEDGMSYIRKGIDYDRVREGYDKAQTAVSFIKRLAQERGFTDENEFIRAAEQELEQAKMDELVRQSIPAELAKEILEGRKFREEMKAKESALKERERQEQEIQQFRQLFPDVQDKDIPEELWSDFVQGKSLIEGYRGHRLQQAESELAELKKQLQIQNQNTDNAASAADSLTGKGTETERGYTEADLKSMSVTDMKNNWDKVLKFIKG